MNQGVLFFRSLGADQHFLFSRQTMWIERTTYTTAYTFPGILKWFEVKQISTVSLVKLELRKIFLSPNIIRCFVQSPLQFSGAQSASSGQLRFPKGE